MFPRAKPPERLPGACDVFGSFLAGGAAADGDDDGREERLGRIRQGRRSEGREGEGRDDGA